MGQESCTAAKPPGSETDISAYFTNIDNSCCGLVCFNADGQYSVREINNGLLKMLGFGSRAEFSKFSGMYFANALHPDDLSSFEAYLLRCPADGANDQFVCRIRRRDLSYGWFMVKKSPECSESTDDAITCSCVDISGLVRLQQKIARQEESLKNIKLELDTIIENTPGGVHSCRLFDGIFLEYASDGLCQMVGYTRDEISTIFGDKYVLMLHEDDRPAFKDAIHRLVEFQHTENLRYRLRCKDGHIIWVADTIKSVRNTEGKMWAYAVVTNIDKEQMAHLELKALTDSMPAGVATYEYSGGQLRIQYFNDYLCKMVGCSREEYQKTAVQDPFFHVCGDELAELKEALTQTLRSGAAFDRSVRVNTSCGVRWCRMIMRIVGNKTDKILLNAVIIDITEHKEREDNLAFQQESLNMIDRALSAGTIINGLGIDKPLYYVSQNICNLLGYSVEEFSRMYKESYAAVIHPADFQRVCELNEKYAVELPARFGMEFRFVKKDDSVIWVMEKATRLDDYRGKCAYISVFVDITELKKAQEQLRIREEEYRIAVSHSNGIVCRYDIASKSIYITPQAAETGNLSRTVIENVPQSIIDRGLIAPESIKKYKYLYDAAARGENVNNIEIRHKIGDVSKWFRCESTVIRNENGEPASAVVSFVDIDREKQQAVEISALKEDEQLLRIIAKSSHRIVLRYDISEDMLVPFYGLTKHYFRKNAILHPVEYFIKNGGLAGESIGVMRKFSRDILSGKRRGTAECRMKNLKGVWQWYNLCFATVFDNSGRPVYAVITVENVTASHEKEIIYLRYKDMISSSTEETIFRMEYDLTADLLETWDSNALVEDTGKASVKFTDGMRQIIEHDIWPEDRSKFSKFVDRSRLLNAFFAGNTQDSCEVRLQPNGTGDPAWTQITLYMVSDPYSSNVKVMLLGKDIDAKKANELEMLARTQLDGLTGLYNRNTFVEKILEKAKTADRMMLHAFAIIDIDNFKLINDTFGHPYGDCVLRDIAHIIRSMVFKDDIVGRIGGDEFAVCMSGFPSTEMLKEKIRILCLAVSRNFAGDKHLSISVGVALCPTDGCCFDELYKKADLALYQAKRTGRDKFMFYSNSLGEQTGTEPRSPIDEPKDNDCRVEIRTFGYFDVFVDGKAMPFQYEKTKELLALLVDRRGGFVSAVEAISCLWENEPANKTTLSRYRKLAFRLRQHLAEYGAVSIIESKNGARRIVPENVKCDLFDFMSGDAAARNLFRGAYMTNYSWAETTLASLQYNNN